MEQPPGQGPLAQLIPATIPGRASHRPNTELHPDTTGATQQMPLPGSSSVLGAVPYGLAELGTDTCHAGPHVGISVSPILSCCPRDAGGSIPEPFSLLQWDGSSTLLTAQHGTQPCHAVPSHATLCCAVPRWSHFAADRPCCKPQVRAAQRCKRLSAHGTPHHDQDQDLPVLAEVVGQDHSLPHVLMAQQ